MTDQVHPHYFPGVPAVPVPDILTEDEAIRFLRLDQTNTQDPHLTLARYRKRGLLRGTQISRNIRYLREELIEFARRQTEVNPR